MKVAFASCCRYEAFDDQPEWAAIQAQDPDYLMLLGDQIYMDYGYVGEEPIWRKPHDVEQFKARMEAKYQQQFREKHFAALFAQMHAKNAVLATWDDHDFAWNGACGGEMTSPFELQIKRIALEQFCQNYRFPEGREHLYEYRDTEQARLVVLDCRSYAQRPGNDRDLLGEAQFVFLEQVLQHDRPFTIIGSSLTIADGGENWGKYKRDLARLIELLRQCEAGGSRVFWLSGDIHRNSFRAPARHFPFFEITSSGLAVNYLGLGGWPHLDDCHNWGLLEIDKDGVFVMLVGRRRTCRYRIGLDGHWSKLDRCERRLTSKQRPSGK